MALSGRILGTFGGASNSQVRPVITWTATQSTSGNYSTVTANLIFENYRPDLWNSYNRNGHSVTFTINGNKSTSSRTFDIRNKDSQTVWTRTVRVNHNSDGKKSFSLSVSGNTGVRLGSYNFNGTGALTQIPRASSLTSFTINAHLQPGTANRVNLGISRASGSSFNHDIQLRDGGTVLQSWNNQGVPPTLTIDSSTVNTLLSRMSSNTTRTLTLRVQTKSGSTNVGSALTRTATATVNSNVRPTATGLSVSIDGSGRDSSRKIYVQGVSRASVKVNSSATGGASITSRRIVVRHNGTKGDVSTITSGSGTSGILTQSGTYEVIATVTDSRGRTNTETRTTFTVEAYSPPRITTFSAAREDVEPYTTVDINREGSFSPIGTGHNTLTISVQRRSGTGSWANVVDNVTTTSTTFKGTENSPGNSVTSSYEFRVVLTDLFGGRAEATATVSTQRTVLDIHKNEGVGIGKIHERGVLDINGDLFLDGTVQIVPNPDGSGKSNPLQIYSSDDNGHGYFEFYGNDGNRKAILGIPTWDAEHIELRNEIGGNTRVQAGRDTVTLRAPEIHLNGKVRYDGVVTGHTLWSGVRYMTGNHTIKPTVNLEDCPNGWLLVFSSYANGVEGNNNFNHVFIHKRHVALFHGQGVWANLRNSSTDKANASKYLYISNSQIDGHASNGSGGAQNQVLRRVLGW